MHLPVSQQMPVDELEWKLVCHTESASLASSSSEGEGGGGGVDGEVRDQGFGLRENPKKSVWLADPEFSFAGPVMLQDRDSETESSKNPTRKRSKRARKSSPVYSSHHPPPPLPPPPMDAKKRIKLGNVSFRVEESRCQVEPELVSTSISDAATEEDVAFCLMMLSRDKRRQRKQTEEEEADFVRDEDFEVEEEEEEEDNEDEEEEETDQSEELLENYTVMADNKNNGSKGRYKCETCSKTFQSYQALGGHRASHMKAQQQPPSAVPMAARKAGPRPSTAKRDPDKVHKCPYCSRVFSSGQALGGHKRSHTTNYRTSITVPVAGKKLVDTLIDLNLPATVNDC